MAIIAKLIPVATILFSIIAGILFYYWISQLSKEEKREQVGKVTDFLISFGFFMWLGKFIINFSVFIKDPLAVLTYPGDSTAFYVAITGSIVRVAFKQKKMQVTTFLNTVLPIILTASFMFEFIQFLQNNNLYSFINMIFYQILLIIFIFYYLNDRISTYTLYFILLISWFIGTLLLSFSQQYVLFFGYFLSLQFILVFFLFNTSVLIYIKTKR